MKLYFVPGACSLSPHILIHELGLSAEIELVNLSNKTTASGRNFLEINPKGYVPALELDSGEVLTEGVAIVSYLSHLKQPFQGSQLSSWRQLEWLAFISSEMHKGIGSLFATPDPEARQKGWEKVQPRLAWVNQQLQNREFLQEQFSAADAYLFTTLSWVGYLGFDLKAYPALQAYLERLQQRPSVKAALEAEKALTPA
jgi:glutathione S-transferase